MVHTTRRLRPCLAIVGAELEKKREEDERSKQNLF
jgi:hypothetical protein